MRDATARLRRQKARIALRSSGLALNHSAWAADRQRAS